MAKATDVRILFSSACSFELSCFVLQQVPSNIKGGTDIPSAVCHAFAVEAYYKVLITIEVGSFPENEHHLLRLHECCTEASQKRLEREWISHNRKYLAALAKGMKELKFGGPVPRTLRAGLTLAAKAFVDFRYQDSNRPMNYQLRNLGALLRAIIIEKRPDLEFHPPSPLAVLPKAT